MKRVSAILSTLPVLAAATLVSFAQQPQQGTQSVVVRQRVMPSQDGAPPIPPPGNMVFMSTEVNFGGKVVKGAPYSAQAVTESIQTLGDGNRIVNRSTSTLYRDSEGRTRRELTLKLPGTLGDVAEPLQTVFINDPVAGVSYTLDSKNRTASKSVPFRISEKSGTNGTFHTEDGARFEFKVEGGSGSGSGSGNGVIVKTPTSGAPAVAGVAAEGGHWFSIQTATGSGGGYVIRRSGPGDNEVKEQLGKQFIEGVEAEGTRVTITIPAGEIGNDRPIQIVSERWYSPELQMDVMTRHSDPRSGETTYRLTNILRLDPAKSLFEVPPDYSIKETRISGVGVGVGPVIKMRKPE